MGSNFEFGESPLFGLPVSPITQKINEKIGLVEKKEKPRIPQPQAIGPTIIRPEINENAVNNQRGRRVTLLTGSELEGSPITPSSNAGRSPLLG
jgi:hypothetical protein